MNEKITIWNLIKFIYRRVLSQWIVLSVCLLVLLLTAFIEFQIPQITKNIIDIAIPNQDVSRLAYYVMSLLVFAVLLGFLNYVSTYYISKISQKAITNLKNELFAHTIGLDTAYYEDSKTGDLMERFGSDVRNLQDLISANTLARLADIVSFIFVYVFMIRTDLVLTLCITVTLPIIFLINRIFNRAIKKAYRSVRTSSSKVNSILQQALSSISLIKNSGTEEFEVERFTSANDENMELTVEAIRLQAIYGPLIDFVNYLGLAIVLSYGAYLVIQGHITVGILISYISYLKMLQSPIKSFSSMINRLQQALVSYERIVDLLKVQATIVNADNAVVLTEMSESIVFDGVSFNYDGFNNVLENVNFTIPQGKMTALVGSSGSGKTTITKLMTRLYDVSDGAVLVDGVNLKEIELSSLRSMIASVAQNVELIDGTIKENIMYGNPGATDEELEKAIDCAKLKELVDSLDLGYETQIGERGVKLSGGERQRIAIARSFLKDASLLILDEATASLDNESEKHIQNSLNVLLKGKTSLVIAHRLTTIYDADNIIVLEDGHIVESGTHEALIEASGRYQKLYETQFKS